MPVVASIDYTARLIYLSIDTVDADLDTLDVYKEVRALRRTVEGDRRWKAMIVAGGNVEKIVATTFTAPYVQLLFGCRIVPYDSSHKIRLIRDTFTDDGLAGRDCFDRTPLTAGVDVDIDVQVDAVEVRLVGTGSPTVIADAVWAVLEAAGTDPGTMGDLLRKARIAADDAAVFALVFKSD